MEIHTFDIPETTKHQAANKVEEFIQENVGPILFMVSGGSAMDLLNHINPIVLGNYLTITTLDERYSFDPKINNFAKLTKTKFYKRAKKQNCKFLDTRPTDGEVLKTFSKRLNNQLKQWFEQNPEGVVIITQGIGSDGHTAGIIPYLHEKDSFEERFVYTDKSMVGYNAEDKNKHPLRVTATIPFLQEVVDHSVLYAVGEKKKDPLQDIFESNNDLHKVPGRIIHHMKDVHLFTDQEIPTE